jgi:hypothetical protein
MISPSILLKMRNVSDKRRRENQNTHFMLNDFYSEYHAVYDAMWGNIVELEGPQMTI